MLLEAKKREKAANALLGLAFAASAAQSPKDFVRTGHIESPGTALMQRWGKVRGEAERNLDHGRVGPSGRNRKVKTFEEFVAEAKKCWPGYKKKGTQKLFGKTYNRCVKDIEEDYKKLPRERMQQQYNRKKDKNYDEFRKKNPTGDGPRISRGKSDTEIDRHGNSRQTKEISSQLKNNPRFYDDSHEMWQRMQSKYVNKKNSNATSKVTKKLISRVNEDWSKKYKDSIDCNNPKGFSQKAHCAGRKKRK